MREDARLEKLLTALHFQRVCEAGKKYRGTYLSIYILPSPNGVSRAGVSVGKRVGNAVTRNRAKRLIRETLRLSRHCVSTRVWIVCVAKKEIVGAGFSQVEADLLKLLERSGASR